MSRWSIGRRLRAVRVRATLAATAVVGVALVVAGITLTLVLRESQLRSIDTALELRARDIESLIVDGGDFGPVRVEDADDSFVQVIDRAGNVVKASDNIIGQPSFIDAGRVHSGDESDGGRDDGRQNVRHRDQTLTTTVPSISDDEFRVRVRRIQGVATQSGEPLAIVVGANLEYVDEVLDTARRALLAGLPLLLLLIGVMIWLVVGRALRPVEAIRAGVAEIGGGDLHRRVPEPATGDEIGRLAKTMNGMLDRLESADVAQSRFVSNASHELRTPIAIIRHELEVALRGDDDALVRQAAEGALDEDLRMQRLVDDLLFLARRDAARGVARDMPRDLVDLDDIALAEGHRVRTDKQVDTSHVSAGQVRGSEEQLSRVLRNLIDNALRHAASRVSIVVASDDGRVVVHVDDDGAGVSDTDRDRIFERFERADEARARDDGGSGLGLAIAAELVADHHGTITVGTSNDLGGARFTVTLTDARR